MDADGYVPNPALEDATWERIVCSCGTVVAMTNGEIVRYYCTDRRCRRPGQAHLVYIALATMPPVQVADTYIDR